jgi:hypothetical protein
MSTLWNFHIPKIKRVLQYTIAVKKNKRKSLLTLDCVKIRHCGLFDVKLCYSITLKYVLNSLYVLYIFNL